MLCILYLIYTYDVVETIYYIFPCSKILNFDFIFLVIKPSFNILLNVKAENKI